MIFRRNSDRGLQKSIVKEVSKASIKDKLTTPKTTLGKMLQNRKVAKFEQAKLNTLKDISRRQQGIFGKAVEAARDLGTTLIATETAKDLSNPNSYRSSLSAWTKNIAGNPNPDTGEDGEKQSRSTSELGG